MYNKLPTQIQQRLAYQSIHINKCDGRLNTLLRLFNDPSLSVRTFMNNTDMVMTDILYNVGEIVKEPICVDYFNKTNSAFKKVYKEYKDNGSPGKKHLAFLLYKKLGPLNFPTEFDDFSFGKCTLNADIKYLKN
jgi:hypothetical protein